MSKLVTADNLLTTFPASLSADEKQLALARVTALELVELYEDNDILALYARIDDLDEPLLDILAYDFKVDWWDENYSLTEKRETFKQCWNVKRTLGTPLSSYLAFSAIFQNATIQEWWQYGGNPHYFKIHIELGGVLTDYDKLQRVVNGIRFYKNKRSLLETIEIDIEKSTDVFVGFAMQGGTKTEMIVGGINPDDYTFLADENDALLLDEKGRLLLD